VDSGYAGYAGRQLIGLDRLVRPAAVEAVQRIGAASSLGRTRARITEHRSSGIGKVATTRELLTRVFYGLRDGHIRALAKVPARGSRTQPAREAETVLTPPVGVVCLSL
jgi:hypothetical protein